MANKAYIVTLKEDNTGDINYPRTLASAVYDDDGTLSFDNVKTSIAKNAKDIKDINGYLESNTDYLFALAVKAATTKEEYNNVMHDFFIKNGCNAMAPGGLTALCDRWYTISRTGWSGYTEFSQPDISSVSTGTKGGDNAGMTCVPSTDTVAGQDDYASNPLFAVVDCNWVINPDTLKVQVTAIDGITGNFERSNPEKYVGVMQMTPWHYYDEKETTYLHGVADHFEEGHDYCAPIPEAVRIDGIVSPWVVHSKYMAALVNDKLTACAGYIAKAHNISHNTLQTYSNNNGTGYSGASIMDYAFLQLMAMVKYGQMTLDAKIQGAVNNNKQSWAAVAETDTNRVILSAADGAYFEVGMGCLVGNYTSSMDRSNSGIYSLSGQYGAIITNKETVNIDGTDYVALTFKVQNADGTFNESPAWTTAVNGANTEGSTVVSTFHWPSGTNDRVLGNDGSIVSASSGKYPGKLQGIEFAVGAYEVMGDVILNINNSQYTVHICNVRSNQSSSITSNYVDTGLSSPCPASAGWRYIRKLGFAKGVFFGVDTGIDKTTSGSSSTYTRDGFYMNGASTSGTREWLAFGYLGGGATNGGLSFLHGGDGLSGTDWNVASRLSCNGNRG